jgi:hypothetical protein
MTGLRDQHHCIFPHSNEEWTVTAGWVEYRFSGTLSLEQERRL